MATREETVKIIFSAENNAGGALTEITDQIQRFKDLGGEVTTALGGIPGSKQVNIETTTDMESIRETGQTINEFFTDRRAMIDLEPRMEPGDVQDIIDLIENQIPESRDIDLLMNYDPRGIKDLTASIDGIPTTKDVTFSIDDLGTIERTQKVLDESFPNEWGLDVLTEVDQMTIDVANRMIDRSIPRTRYMEIKPVYKNLPGLPDFNRPLVIDTNDPTKKTPTKTPPQQINMKIEVNGQGLQPHLEAFMFEILKAIQIRAVAQGAQFLVGV